MTLNESQIRKKERMRKIAGGVAAVAVVVLGIVFLGGTWSGTSNPPPDKAELEDVADFPSVYAGDWVEIEGEVKRVYPNGTFAIGERGIIEGAQILVVPHPSLRTPQQGDDIVIGGEVGLVSSDDDEQPAGVELEPETIDAWMGKALILHKPDTPVAKNP